MNNTISVMTELALAGSLLLAAATVLVELGRRSRQLRPIRIESRTRGRGGR